MNKTEEQQRDNKKAASVFIKSIEAKVEPL
jgi:hypothetical protein